MKKHVPFLLLLGVFFLTAPVALAQGDGAEIFKKNCTACHTVGKGRLVGPDLANLHNRRSNEWIVKFVQGSQSFIQSGDQDAKAIFEEFNQIVMPDQPVTEGEVQAIVEYIAANSPAPEGPAPEELAAEKVVAPEEPSLEGDAGHGQLLFSGVKRFSNGGPSCISCHNVNNDQILAGGALAKDLTEAYTRLTEAGVRAVIANPSGFPQMGNSFRNNPLTEQEVADLVAFLRVTDEQKLYQHTYDYQQLMLIAGVCGIIALLGVYALFWFNRKRKAVNKDVFDRQVWS